MSRFLDWLAVFICVGLGLAFLSVLYSARALTVTYVLPGEGNAGPLLLTHQKLAANSWIDRESNFKGERCCDAGKDCHTLPPERVRPTAGGVLVRLNDGKEIFVPGDRIQVSRDGHYWVCYWGEQVRCFHAPYSGS